MRIGITYDLKSDRPLPADLPDDIQEEFDSPATIEAIASVLRSLGHDVRKLGDGRELLERLLADPPDFVFNFAEGQGISRSREARVPAVLEMLGIPYTGSDALTMAATLDKDCARRLVGTGGIVVPTGFVIEPHDDLNELLDDDFFQGDVAIAIVKPAWEGSSKGIRNKCVVKSPGELRAVVEGMRRDYRQALLVEEYIQGDEVTVGIVGNERPHIIGVMRVVPNFVTDHFVYSLEVKRDYLRQVRYEVPAPLPAPFLKKIEQAALKVFRVLGCRDVARIDFRVRDGVPYFLEVNPLPGLNPESSDLVIMARLAGWTYEQLIESIVQAAIDRTQRADCSFVTSSR
ncbi:MAG: ATP-grasp domain-containing protein [Gemmataceae bacterium]|nr:ATP-grasp domain-containing protein [Gemmataceae bacterium]